MLTLLKNFKENCKDYGIFFWTNHVGYCIMRRQSVKDTFDFIFYQ